MIDIKNIKPTEPDNSMDTIQNFLVTEQGKEVNELVFTHFQKTLTPDFTKNLLRVINALPVSVRQNSKDPRSSITYYKKSDFGRLTQLLVKTFQKNESKYVFEVSEDLFTFLLMLKQTNIGITSIASARELQLYFYLWKKCYFKEAGSSELKSMGLIP